MYFGMKMAAIQKPALVLSYGRVKLPLLRTNRPNFNSLPHA